MDQRKITRKDILAQVLELYDPIGIWEPIRLQLKLRMIPLNNLAWDQELLEEVKEEWVNTFQHFPDLQKLQVSRTVVPEGAVLDTLRLICMADAAEDHSH